MYDQFRLVAKQSVKNHDSFFPDYISYEQGVNQLIIKLIMKINQKVTIITLGEIISPRLIHTLQESFQYLITDIKLSVLHILLNDCYSLNPNKQINKY
jgi:hypothetical protein